MGFQDKIAHFLIIFSGFVTYGLVLGLLLGKFSINFEVILDTLKPFLSPGYTYDFFVDVMSRDYFINDHLIVDKKIISLAIVIAFYSPIVSILIIFAKLFKLAGEDSMLNYLLIPMALSITFLWTLTIVSIVFSIIPTII